MVLRDGTLPTAWLSSRKNSVLRCIERLCAETASEHRRAQRRLQEVEEAMATQNQPGSILPGRTMQTAVPVSGGQSAPAASETELLRRKLAEANAEIRRYETRLFAYERAMLDLRRENAELQALCEQARAGETLPEPTPQPTVPVLEKPELPGHPFPGPRAGCRGGSGTASRRDRDPAGHGHPGVGAQDQAGSPLGGHHLPAGTADGDLTKREKDRCICLTTVHRSFLMLILPRWCGAP